MTRSLIVVAVLLAGCEQLKSPQRISELEDRVNKLSEEVTTLKAGSGSARPGEPAGSGAAAAAGSGSADVGSGSGSAEPGSAAAGADSAGAAAGSDSAAADAPRGGGLGGGEPAVDAGVPDSGASGDKTDRALEELRDVVIRATQASKQGRPPATSAAATAPAITAATAQGPAPAIPSGMPPWAYDGKLGPPTWGTLDPAWRACLLGKSQSPIDIEPKAGTASPVTFHYRPTHATLFDDGRTLQVLLGPGSSIEIDGHTYQLRQAHFHMPSEHTIAGEHYPLELQLVHQDTDGKIAMIGVLYDAGAESRALAEVWSHWPRKVGGEDRPRKPFDPTGLLPETRTVFRYTGSLTAPPCTEGVMWNVMRRAMSDSKAHLDEFARHYPHNARDLQPLGDRKIE